MKTLKTTANIFSALIITTLMIAPMLTATSASASAEKDSGLSPTVYLSSAGYLQLPDDFQGSLDLDGWQVTIDDQHGLQFQPTAATLGAWSSLGGIPTGLTAGVTDIEFDSGVLYVGGDFDNAGGDANADKIAKYSGGTWSSLGGSGTGLSGGWVEDIEFNGGVLYAGGHFTNAGGDPDADYIAKYSGGAWSSLGGAGTGLNGFVQDIEFDNGVLYAGGEFDNAGGDANADMIAKYSGGTWSSLGGAGTGFSDAVFEIEFDSGVLFAGGDFDNAGGDTNADKIAKYSGGTWSSLGGAGTGLNNCVSDIEFYGGVLYAGGGFTNAGGDADANYIAKYSGGTWSSLGGTGTGLPYDVMDIEFYDGTLFAGGYFSNAGGDINADKIAKYTGGTWTSLGGNGTGLNNGVHDIVFYDDVLYAGGHFEDAGGDVNADKIAQYGISVMTPTVNSITRADPSPTNAASVDFNLTFSEAVIGVDTVDVSLTTTGAVTGASVSAVSGSGDIYTVAVDTGAGDGTIRLDVNASGTGIEDLDSNPLDGGFTSGEAYTLEGRPVFLDVPLTHWAVTYIENIYFNGITSGCGPYIYCPSDPVTRAQMAVFLLRAKHGGDYIPPPASGTVFADVSLSHWAASWIEQLATEGITSGCGGGNYCPNDAVTRAQMAVFLLRAKHGSSYVPPPASGTVFADVSLSHWAAKWIEQLAAKGVTSGCGGGNYCPNDPVNRDQMAVFLVKSFNLT